MSVSPAVMRRLMRELTELKKTPPEGIRVQTSEENMLDVTGLIEGPDGTPYAGGYFRVKFKFTEEFPAAPPKCWFATKIFHPNVSAAGEICVNTLKKDWKSEYGIGHILLTVKCLLIYPNPESALDEEAGKLLLEDYKSYCDRAKLITSVHARSKPAEFADATASSGQAASSSGASLPTPSTSAIPPLPSAIFSLPVPIAPIGRKSSSPSPSSHSESQNVKKTLYADKEGGKEKERHVSPSPLSTADANVGGAATAAVKTSSTTPTGTSPQSQNKAVKRAATGAATSGAEKRKKALKRL